MSPRSTRRSRPAYLSSYEDRFEPQHGPLRSVVRRSTDAFLECGRLTNGFARVRCPSCHGEHLLAFSCQTRNFCPSCQAKRAALFAEKLREEILAPVSHRHYVFTIPRVLRGLFQRERRLLGLLSRTAYDTMHRTLVALTDDRDAVPGFVSSIQTFGSYANFHPHVHALMTEAVRDRDGRFLPIPSLDAQTLSELFRRLLLTRLVGADRLSESFRDVLLSWIHSGFSVHACQSVSPDDPERLEHLARYLVRPPMPFSAVERTHDRHVRVLTPPHPEHGSSELLLDPLDWIQAVTDQIPDPRLHLVRYYGAYANRCRNASHRATFPGVDANVESDAEQKSQAEPLKANRASWARLLRKILEVDPLLCPRCRVEMKIVSIIIDHAVVDQIIRHLAHAAARDPFEERPPPLSPGPPLSPLTP